VILEFRRELEGLINKHSIESASDTPDFILCQYLIDCLNAFDRAVIARQKWLAHADKWHGHKDKTPKAELEEK
jgi:hypothetical protein